MAATRSSGYRLGIDEESELLKLLTGLLESGRRPYSWFVQAESVTARATQLALDLDLAELVGPFDHEGSKIRVSDRGIAWIESKSRTK